MYGESDIPSFFAAFGINMNKGDVVFSAIFDQISENIAVQSAVFNSDKASCYVKNEDIFDIPLKKRDVIEMKKNYKGKEYTTKYVIKNIIMDYTGVSQLLLQFETNNDEEPMELENNGY